MHRQVETSTPTSSHSTQTNNTLITQYLLTAVATSIGVLPFLKEASADSLSRCDLSPWILVAGNPSLYKKSSRASAPFFVSTNTRVNDSGPVKGQQDRLIVSIDKQTDLLPALTNRQTYCQH